LAYILDPAHCRKDGADTAFIPWCETCGGLVRPDVVLYEEPLNEKVISGAIKAIGAADLLIVGGTSLVVYPAAGFLNYFNGRSLVQINLSATDADSRSDLTIRRPIGEVFAELTLQYPVR
ncbi:MAG: hypothetical protein LBC58_03205, partial [Clostridiales Family XIII bacterium]|nr:hypothetical protein [Clostridiales Family XIII bacterium]